MEARETFRESRLSKGVAVLFGICVAVVLGVVAAFVAASLTTSKAPAAGSGVVTSGIPDDSAYMAPYRSGTQSIEGPAPSANASQAPDAQERNQQLADRRVVKPHGYI